MKHLVLISIFISSTIFGYSQNRTSIGARVGNFVGLDVKHFFSTKRDFAFQLHLNQKPKSADRGELTRINPMLVFQKKLRFRLPYDVFMFYGGGLHVGQSKLYLDAANELGETVVLKTETGIDGTFGLEAKSRKVPFVFAVDFSPYYNLADIADDNEWLNMGVSVRYLLGFKRR